MKRLRNIGIAAHIDAGKTTLSERILFYAGRIHRMGEVHTAAQGTATTMDHNPQEIQMGITIQSAATRFDWKEHTFHLIDTPGHVDFTVEVERSLRVMDGAVLVLCAVGGVQPQTRTVDRQMRRYELPRIAFVNKLDRVGADPERVIGELREKLGLNARALQIPVDYGDGGLGALVDLVTERLVTFHGDQGRDVRDAPLPAELGDETRARRADLIEAVAELDERMAEAYLAGTPVSADELQAAIRRATLALRFTPVLLGAAFKNRGVQSLLDAVAAYLPAPEERATIAYGPEGEESLLSGRPDAAAVLFAFKSEESKQNSYAWVRLYQGRIRPGDRLRNARTGELQRIARIVRLHAGRQEETDLLESGDIGACFGLAAASGDTYTAPGLNLRLTELFVAAPVITLAIEPADREAEKRFARTLAKLAAEDPTLRIVRDAESGQTLMQGMGELHLQIKRERMATEFGCATVAGAPRVAYRETVTRRAEFDVLWKKQEGGQGQYARIAGYLEPLGSDADEEFEFRSEVRGGSIPSEFIPACRRGFAEQLEAGLLLGAPVKGLRVVVVDGDAHVKDSSDLAFRNCARECFREAYGRAGPVALEPLMRVTIEGPADFQGGMIGLLQQRRGVVMGLEQSSDISRIEAEAPVAEMFGFAGPLRSATRGMGEFSMEFARYARVPEGIRVVAAN